MSNTGKFIVFEGIDGSGKTTQLKLLGEYLKEKGIAYSITREPTDSPIGSLLRKCLSREIETDERAIAALFAADRLDHILRMKDELSRGVTVLCDRYYCSSLAYNGSFASYEWVLALNTPAMESLKPDLTVFVDVSPEESMRRIARRSERERYEELERQRKIRDLYQTTFGRLNENVKTVSSEQSVAATQAQIRKIVDELYSV